MQNRNLLTSLTFKNYKIFAKKNQKLKEKSKTNK